MGSVPGMTDGQSGPSSAEQTMEMRFTIRVIEIQNCLLRFFRN